MRLALPAELFSKTDGSSYNGPASDCNKCHYTAYNCTNVDRSRFTIVQREPFDSLSGKLVGACKFAVGNCTGAACTDLVTPVPCDPIHRFTPAQSAGPESHKMPLELGWFGAL